MYEEVKDPKIMQITAKENGAPYSAIIEIITKCNFNCEHCYIPEHRGNASCRCFKHCRSIIRYWRF